MAAVLAVSATAHIARHAKVLFMVASLMTAGLAMCLAAGRVRRKRRLVSIGHDCNRIWLCGAALRLNGC